MKIPIAGNALPMPKAPALVHRYAELILESAARHGIDAKDIITASGQRFGPEDLAKIARRVKLALGDEFFGFTQKGCRLGTYRLICEACALSEKLGDALLRAVSLFNILADELAVSLHIGNDICIIEIAGGSGPGGALLREWWSLIWHRLSQWLVGDEIPLLASELSHSPLGPLTEYRNVFNGNVGFNRSRTSIAFTARSLERPVARRVSDLGQFIAAPVIDLISTPGPIRPSARSLVKTLLRARLDAGYELATLDDIASQLALSAQTVRRRLKDEKTSFKAIKHEVRFEFALKMLADPSVSIQGLHQLAGYAEPGGFARALKTWTGFSPQDYRRHILGRD